MSKIGRNDPCPCGSGKKYKHCCKDKVKVEQSQDRDHEKAQQDFIPEEVQQMKEDQQRSVLVAISKAALECAKRLPFIKQGELDAITWKMEIAVQFEENKADIMKAAKLLLRYLDEYHAWAENHHTEAVQHALHLFEEETFEKVSFKKEDFMRIVKKRGAPPDFTKTERYQEYVFRALHILLDQLDVNAIAQHLLLQIPYYFSQKRYKDACMILDSAFQVFDFKKKNNAYLPPFLFCKFVQAQTIWVDDIMQESTGVLQRIRLGVDEFRNKFLSKAKKKYLDLSEDQKAKFDEYLRQHSEGGWIQGTEPAEKEDLLNELLNTDEGASLLFKDEELLPWVGRMVKIMSEDRRLQDSVNKIRVLNAEEQEEIFWEIMDKVSEEMAHMVFTEKRLVRLNQDIQTAQKNLQQKGHTEFNAFFDIWQAINKSVSPQFSLVNIMLCKVSLLKYLLELKRQELQHKT